MPADQRDDDGTDLIYLDAARPMVPTLIAMDAANFDPPWDEVQWRGLVSLSEDDREKERVVVAAEKLGPAQYRIHAFAAWTRIPGSDEMRLAKLVVQPLARRNRIGMTLANGGWEQPTPLVADVPERNLLAQKFLRGCGWVGAYHGPRDENGDRSIRFSTLGLANRPDALLVVEKIEVSEPRRNEKEKN